MNQLSWFLYIADVAGSLGKVAIAFGVVLTIVGLVGTAAWLISSTIRASDNDKSWDEWVILWSVPRKALPYGIALILVACVLPSRNTMYAIAASQVGEQVINSEAVRGTASEATKALQFWIREQIEPTKDGK